MNNCCHSLALILSKQLVLGVESDIIDVPTGVPQGGHLSPLLFALFINDIKRSIVNCQFLLFADDLKLFFLN